MYCYTIRYKYFSVVIKPMKTFFQRLEPRAQAGLLLIALSCILFCTAFLFPSLSLHLKGETVAAITLAIGISAELLSLFGVALVGKEGILRLKESIKAQFQKKESSTSL